MAASSTSVKVCRDEVGETGRDALSLLISSSSARTRVTPEKSIHAFLSKSEWYDTMRLVHIFANEPLVLHGLRRVLYGAVLAAVSGRPKETHIKTASNTHSSTGCPGHPLVRSQMAPSIPPHDTTAAYTLTQTHTHAHAQLRLNASEKVD
jgi:hypothetical protein